ncbi:MAG: prepilin-type N-terminal cleavage/methylation domain-containing protein [Planctomycetota bacterium]|nr:prepilin-type N-terminal cleavage/methylation domain-containing protein [Planctomycetota bacterium]
MNHPAIRPAARSADPIPPSRGGFTLIELLVVVGIIAVLVGILAPAIKGVMEMARQGQCTSNLHEMALGQRAYASGAINAGVYVPGIPNVDGGSGLPGPECVWIAKPVPSGYAQGNYRTHGVLANLKYISFGVMYCPSWEVEAWLPGKYATASGIDAWTFPSAGRVGGWVGEAGLGGYMALVSTYFTRTTFGGISYTDYKNWRPAALTEDPPSQALMSEAFYGPTIDSAGASVMGFRTTHPTSLGVAYLDDHAEMVTPANDKGKNAGLIFAPGGATPWGDNITFYGNIERVFNEFLSKTVK